MILCVTANAAIDKTAVTSPFRLNAIHRPQQLLALPGGKGCNVARALKTLGETPVVTGWVGGFAGQFIETGLNREGIETAFVHTESESRTCLSILDPDNHTLTELYENGAPIPADKLAELIDLFRAIIGRYAAVALSGSLPAGVPADFYAQLIEIAHQAGVPVYLDSSGAALVQGVAARPFLIKPNEHEFEGLTGMPFDKASAAQAARAAAARYQTMIALSLGADGAMLATETQVVHAKPAPRTIQSAVGSGDSLLAGIICGLTRDFALDEALRYGVAAGTANALRLGAGIFTREDFDAVLRDVAVVGS